MQTSTISSIPEALRVLRETFGYPEFRGQQQDVIDHVTAGGDALVLMPTGGGKSLCYQVPALLRPGTAVIVSPSEDVGQTRGCALSLEPERVREHGL